MSVGQIIIDLLMRTGSFETDTKRAASRLKDLEKSATRLGATFGAEFAAAATAVAYFVKASIDGADAALKNAQSIGVTVEAYTSLAFAADLSGISQEEMNVALTKLARTAADAAGGSKSAAAWFKAMGISLQTANGSIKDTDVLLDEVADKFASYADGTAKTALATEGFGRAGARLIPLLNGGSAAIAAARREAAELGVVMDTKTAKAAEQLNDDISRLHFIVRGFGNDLMRATLPALQGTATALLDMRNRSVEAGQYLPLLTGLMSGLALEAARSSVQIYVFGVQLGETLAKAAIVAQSLKEMVDGSNTSNMDILRRAWAGFNAISEGVKADVDRARSELKRLEFALSPEGQAATRLGQDPRELARRGRGPATPGTLQAPVVQSSDPSGAPKLSEAARYLESLRKQLQATKDLSVEEALLADIKAGRLGKVLPAQEAELRLVARQIDAAKAAAEAERQWKEYARADDAERKRTLEEIAQAEAEAAQASEARLATLTSGTYSEQLKEVTSDIGFLNRAYEEGKVSVELWAEAVTQATGRLQQQADEVDSFAKTMQENMQTFLGSAFADAMEGNFKNIGRSFTQMVNRMVAEALAADLMRRLFGSGVKGGSGDGWIGTALNAFSTWAGSKAGGGDVMPGRSYWVGEQGPERFVPRTAGTILPAATSAGAGGRSVVVNNSFTVTGAVDRRTQMQIAAEASRAVSFAATRNN